MCIRDSLSSAAVSYTNQISCHCLINCLFRLNFWFCNFRRSSYLNLLCFSWCLCRLCGCPVSHFAAAIPATCKRIAVLDRNKETGSVGEPVYLDVACATPFIGKPRFSEKTISFLNSPSILSP